MTYHDELRLMRAAVERRNNAKLEPDAYGFDDPATLVAIRDALAAAIARARDAKGRLIVRLGLKEDGSPEAWVLVRSGDDLLYVGDFSYTCPPRTDCA